ncbi:hypothetical protein DIZ81_06650 [Legionella taurinensis]|uniref:Uncharacterized protein n=1 Tax=Legionella taurinensis TaxID=70611 RepID=A0A3A5LJK7_9GAMM|nr:hypothetical protein [Legionella taurinensis]MDX1837250.1 hypothetical protein [Legionella taurinensis]PUT40277.1 hypothetical protein DB744_06650 [Legionella taurinensis]PUT41511.1 hypothetical protein DB746_09160 [Legionella taurinensis]PUT44377.1 hypothetical protein DB743_08375 [Legionella taurinensis]PUT48339.1 hypothetical protein DB745_05050 [Legionella taurinensis]
MSSDDDVIKSFVKQDAAELTNATHAANTVALEYGPLNKNDATLQFEQLVKAFLATQVTPDAPPVTFKVENDKLMASFQGQDYNVSDLIKQANMNHLLFDEQDAANYMVLLQSPQCHYPPSLKHSSNPIPSMADYEAQEKQGKHPDALQGLNWAEKSAINIYSGGFYVVCNKVLRGDLSRIENHDSQQIGEILVTAAMGCAGLNKISESSPRFTFRVEENFSEEFTKKRIEAVERGGDVTVEMGFFSTAFAPSDDEMFNAMNTELFNAGGGTGIVLSDLRGKYIAGIASKPDEFEYLVPPTQMQWVGHYQTENGSHFFHARPVQTLTGLTAEQQKRTAPANDSTPILSTDFKARLNDVKNADGDEVKQPYKPS